MSDEVDPSISDIPVPESAQHAVAYVAQAARFFGWNIAVRFEPPDDGEFIGMAIGTPEALDKLRWD